MTVRGCEGFEVRDKGQRPAGWLASGGQSRWAPRGEEPKDDSLDRRLVDHTLPTAPRPLAVGELEKPSNEASCASPAPEFYCKP
jgi:hypothetical protein